MNTTAKEEVQNKNSEHTLLKKYIALVGSLKGTYFLYTQPPWINDEEWMTLKEIASDPQINQWTGTAHEANDTNPAPTQ